MKIFCQPKPRARLSLSWLIVFSIFAALSCGRKGAEEDSKPSFAVETTARISYVIDGDTVILDGGEKVRFLGINAPEIWKSEGDRPDEPWGRDAANYLTVLLPKGTEIGLGTDVNKKDLYGRTLAYIYLKDEMVNARLLEEGYARYNDYGSELKHGEYLKKQERKAHLRGLGLWEGKGSRKPPVYFVASKNSTYYHEPGSEFGKKIKATNRYRVTEAEARRLGLQPSQSVK